MTVGWNEDYSNMKKNWVKRIEMSRSQLETDHGVVWVAVSDQQRVSCVQYPSVAEICHSNNIHSWKTSYTKLLNRLPSNWLSLNWTNVNIVNRVWLVFNGFLVFSTSMLVSQRIRSAQFSVAKMGHSTLQESFQLASKIRGGTAIPWFVAKLGCTLWIFSGISLIFHSYSNLKGWIYIVSSYKPQHLLLGFSLIFSLIAWSNPSHTASFKHHTASPTGWCPMVYKTHSTSILIYTINHS